ncbi:HDOD domain-containing protein [Marinobacter xestospongiae]|uniref:HDOD domain-containing protein n=1 Tax=Marinobacter xestospongiae TaxID=994319 RepID=UPI0020031B9B|nr:HDOD domain-containing protein [Marinobacter xestospongiae]MCK7567645.1 HDOD domain-containing protein [Marinobacter xestospongiae]
MDQTTLPAIDLPSLPEVSLKALEACRNGEGHRAIAAILASDTGLTARILSLANSSLYGRCGTIRSLDQALLRLGTRQIETLVLTAALQQLMQELGSEQWQQLRDFWRHSLTSALLAKALATLTRYPEPAEAFLLGMLHNIGELVALREPDPDRRQRLLQQHPLLAARLAEAWGLGAMAADAMRHQQAPPDDIGDASHLVKLINLSTRLALSDAAGLHSAMTVFDLGEELTLEIKRRIDHEVDAFALTLDIPLDGDYSPTSGRQALRQAVAEQALLEQAQPAASLQQAAATLTLITGLPALSFGIQDDALVLLGRSHGDLPTMTLDAEPAHSALTRAYADGQPAPISPDSATVLDQQLLGLLGTAALIALPVATEGQSFGVLVLGLSQPDQPAPPLATRYCQRLARALALPQPSPSAPPAATSALQRQIHEISNPLTIVRQYVHQLQHRALTDDLQQDLTVIREELERASRLLLQMGQPDTPDTRPATDAVELNSELVALQPLFRDSLFSGDDRVLALDLCPVAADITVPRSQLRQLIINLVRNAAEALGERGRVWLRTITPVWQNGQRWVELSVEDDGPGLPPGVQQRLFQPVSSTKGCGHSGLGLSITKQLVDDMEGHISCRTGDSGTQFRILLPAADLPDHSRQTQASADD